MNSSLFLVTTAMFTFDVRSSKLNQGKLYWHTNSCLFAHRAPIPALFQYVLPSSSACRIFPSTNSLTEGGGGTDGSLLGGHMGVCESALTKTIRVLRGCRPCCSSLGRTTRCIWTHGMKGDSINCLSIGDRLRRTVIA